METIPEAGQAAREGTITRYAGWLAVPHGLRTVAQWRREGRTVRAACKQTPAGVVDWDGLAVKVYGEDQTTPYNPRPATLAFREDCRAFTAFLNPRRDKYAFKPRREWEHKDWPQTQAHLSDDTLEKAFSHREGLAILPASAGDSRWFALDTDFHDPTGDPGRFLAQVAAVHDILTEEGDDFFMACREKDISGLHFWGFGPEGLSLADILRYANGLKSRLIACRPNLFDASLEVYPDPGRPFRLPIFPGRCPILDVPLEGLPPREQLARLVRWIDRPGRPMSRDHLLDWVRARLPRPPAIREGGANYLLRTRLLPLLAFPPFPACPVRLLTGRGEANYLLRTRRCRPPARTPARWRTSSSPAWNAIHRTPATFPTRATTPRGPGPSWPAAWPIRSRCVRRRGRGPPGRSSTAWGCRQRPPSRSSWAGPWSPAPSSTEGRGGARPDATSRPIGRRSIASRAGTLLCGSSTRSGRTLVSHYQPRRWRTDRLRHHCPSSSRQSTPSQRRLPQKRGSRRQGSGPGWTIGAASSRFSTRSGA